MSRWTDMTGWKMQQHGVPDSRLTVLSFERMRESVSGRKSRVWKCLCSCGNITYVCTKDLNNGNKKSCGCLRSETTARFNIKTKTTHHEGRTNSRLYVIWGNIKARCNNPNDHAYSRYGGRGIKICDEWNESYEAFRDWALSNGYADELTIDRIDVNSDYEPSNCRWITMKEQQNNKSNNIRIEFNGEVHTVSEWEDIVGIKADTIRDRLKDGWSVEKSLTQPVRKWVKHNV